MCWLETWDWLLVMWYPSKGWTSGSSYTRIPHHQQPIPLHNTSTPQVSLHNNATSSRKLLKMDVLTSETCWAVNWHKKASVIKLVYLYSNIKTMHGLNYYQTYSASFQRYYILVFGTYNIWFQFHLSYRVYHLLSSWYLQEFQSIKQVVSQQFNCNIRP